MPSALSALLAALGLLPTPPLAVRVDPARPRPGDVLRVEVTGAADPAAVSVTLDGAAVPLFPTGAGRLRGLVGLTAEAPPGPRRFAAVERRRLRSDRRAEAAAEVEGRAYAPQRLRMPKARARLREHPGARDALARIRAVAAVDTPRQLWSGPFRPPAPGRVSGGYGHPRTVNGRPWAWHKGVDIAARAGAAVAAPAAGVVALAGHYPLQGGTVVIDHGQGVMSALLDLGEVLVKAGDEVAASSPVARVGGGGFSTGPHVHWGLYVHGKAVDPEALTRRAL